MSIRTLDSDDAVGNSDGWNYDDRPPSFAVIEALADAEGVDPLDLDVPLYNFVDLEALDTIFLEGNTPNTTVEFSLDGYLVTIRGTGNVEIDANTL